MFNCAPSNFREVNEVDFVDSRMLSFSIYKTEYRQILSHNIDRELMLEDPPSFIDIHLHFVCDNEGYGIYRDFQKKRLRFFLFGCNHKIKEERLSMHRTKVSCTKCDYSDVIDSSD